MNRTASQTKRRNAKTKKWKACPFCDGSIYKKYTGLKDRLFTTNKTFSVYECSNCHAALLNPAPTGKEVSSFYPDFYLSGEETSQNVVTRFDLEKWYRYNQYRYDFELLERPTGLEVDDISSYLDIGCGSGERVTYASEHGCERSVGVDKFDFAKSKSKQEIEIINSEILDYKPKTKFQVASLFHVLEHLENPQEILAHIRNNILSTNGHLIIQVPNYSSLERKIFNGRWFGLDVPRHFWDFNQEALCKLLEQSGYKVEAAYQLNAPLHPVTIAPSLIRDLDVQRIWVNSSYGNWRKKVMKVLWIVMTVATIPLTIIQNLLNRSSMLTVVAKKQY
jgi:SAM-dependent methyltransferase